MRFHRPFFAMSLLAAAAALVLPGSASIAPARAQAAQQATLSNTADTANGRHPKAPAAPTRTTGAVTPPQQISPIRRRPKASPPKRSKRCSGLRSRPAHFSRVPCLPPKRGAKSMGSLPHVANKLASGQPVVIVAFGSSSTQGYGSSSPEFSYPNRLAAQLQRQYPGADITVVNSGHGGEDAPEMMKRLQTSVIDRKPDLVIWQVGTNAVLRNLDPAETAKMVDDGIARIQAAGADLVLVDPQYSPRVIERGESASRMVSLLGKIAELRRVGIFPRFEVMREWHENQALPIDSFVIADGLHMNDWGYAASPNCSATTSSGRSARSSSASTYRRTC